MDGLSILAHKLHLSDDQKESLRRWIVKIFKEDSLTMLENDPAFLNDIARRAHTLIRAAKAGNVHLLRKYIERDTAAIEKNT